MTNQKQYISDVIEKKQLGINDLFNESYRAVITGGTGSGKSTFTCKGLVKILNCKPSEILLVAPLVAIEQQLIAKGNAEKQDLTQAFFKVDNIPVCTYAALMNKIKAKTLSRQIKYFVFDEAHQLITAENYAKYGAFFLKWLDDNGIQALFLTATPMALLTYKYGKKPFTEILGVKSNVKVDKIIFTTEKDLLTHVKYFARNKMFIAVQTVIEAQKLEKQLNDRMPGSAKAIFSKTHDKATDEMRTVADEIIKTEQFPEGVQFLIVNGAYTEGMEIQTKCESALVKLPTVTQIVQAVGRLRKGVEDVVVVLSKDQFYAQTKRSFDEFNKFLIEYRKADELLKRELLLGMYSIQKEQFGHEFVNIHSMNGYVPDYQINMPLYHSFEINLYDAKRLYCENDEISNHQFEQLEAIFKPYFPNSKFVRLTQEGMTSKEDDYDNDMLAFLNDLNNERVYTEQNKNGITVDQICRKVMQLREEHNIINNRPVKCTRSLNNAIDKYGYKMGNRSSQRIRDVFGRTTGDKVTFYLMQHTQKQS